ncbi:uncharacterized protein LOC107865420 [Capsicum annuum]|uniref:uncharacterized protein LOC107865420 n=1 Tax=Capsicum annuum TaxID=4072 RepID=UPI001FB138A6|nr:uncharacterized protein LOC107865420 [Capsicum annuum]
MVYEKKGKHGMPYGYLLNKVFKQYGVDGTKGTAGTAKQMINLTTLVGNECIEGKAGCVSQAGLEEEVKASFCEALDEVMRSVTSSKKIIIAGNFNGHIWILPRGYDDVYGGFAFSDRNDEGSALLDFTKAFGMVVVNLTFLKKEDHLITF